MNVDGRSTQMEVTGRADRKIQNLGIRLTRPPTASGHIDSLRADDIAGFWSGLLERPVNEGANQFFAMIPASADGRFPALMFLAVPEPRQSKNRVHIDLVADDLAAEVERAVTLGATKVADFNEYGATWTTLTDPEGNIFDIGLRRETEQVSS